MGVSIGAFSDKGGGGFTAEIMSLMIPPNPSGWCWNYTAK